MSIMEYNGGSCIAMAGKKCVAIATDLRMGAQAMTVANNAEKVFSLTDKVYVGLPGLYSDTLTVYDHLRTRVNLYKLKEGKTIEPETFMHMVSSSMYERRWGPWFVEPIVAGINSAGDPFIAGTDVIGAINYAHDFIVNGTANDKLFGMAEALWEPDLEPEDLFETISQALMNAVDRDAYSGGGAIVWIIEPDKVTRRVLKTRMD